MTSAFCKKRNRNWHHWTWPTATIHCFCMHADSYVNAHVRQEWTQTNKHMCTYAQSIKHYSWASRVETHMPKHISSFFLFSYRFPKALCTWHVLQIHKGVGEKLCKGDPGIWISLQQPQQKVPAVLGYPGPWRELMHKTRPYYVALNPQDNPVERTADCCQRPSSLTSLLFIKRWP